MIMTTTRPVAPTTDALFDCAAARTLALGDDVRTLLLAAARMRRGAVS